MNRRLRRWLVSLVVILVGWWLLALALAPEPIPVQTVVVERGLVENTVTNTRAGTIKARQRSGIAPEIGGRVAKLHVREGDRVKTGDPLYDLDDSLPAVELERARRQLEASQAEHERACIAADRAVRELARHEKLAREDIVSSDLLDELASSRDEKAAACHVAAANVARDQATVLLLETTLAKTVVRAPFPGVVAEVTIELGEWVTPSPPLLAVPATIDLINPGSLFVSAPMDETDAATLRTELEVRITVDSHPDQEFPGRVTRVAPYVLDVEQQNRTVEIEVEFQDRAFARTLLPGTSADVEVILDSRADVTRVPTSCLFGGEAVLVVEDDVLVHRPLTTGMRNWEFCEVLEGLTPGERVVSSLDRKEIEPGAEVVVTGTGDGR